MVYVILAVTFIALGYISWKEHQNGWKEVHPKRTLLKVGIVMCGLLGVLASVAYLNGGTDASAATSYSQPNH